jgi:hypothetical protein
MLDHAGEVLEVSVGFWRFVLGRTYRRRKLAEWSEANRTPGGRLATAGEIVVSVIIGVGVPIGIAFVIRGLLWP